MKYKDYEEIKKDRLEIDDNGLSDVVGGFAFKDPGFFYQCRFMFNDDEVKEIKEKKGIDLEPYTTYHTGDLKKAFGTNSGVNIRDELKNKLGFNVTHF